MYSGPAGFIKPVKGNIKVVWSHIHYISSKTIIQTDILKCYELKMFHCYIALWFQLHMLKLGEWRHTGHVRSSFYMHMYNWEQDLQLRARFFINKKDCLLNVSLLFSKSDILSVNDYEKHNPLCTMHYKSSYNTLIMPCNAPYNELYNLINNCNHS